MTSSDRDLWRRASEGETEAFGVLFDRHAKAVYNFLFRRTADWSTAEDLTSAVFLHAWRRRDQVVLDRESALPWLLRTADYTVRNEWRSKRRYRNSLPRLLAADQPDHADEVAERLDDQRQARELRHALRRLPAHEREVIELCVWAGLDQQAAAVALDIPLGTVKSRLSRARRRLRDLTLSQLDPDETPETLR
ncbi:RNA polymerase, sigma-24 subunit, ECF subfamily [Kribbella flavida DSM 17836]|uniref:RNA polymerase, sigma-24 subunit, ECF subfamily n=1 Tax=Kribbella flavida (strain DSM 17836 / JCM 10339 / NBRC 14399) TaxID=479435 RepID=D2PX01_KRIFD|nr:sigma-70 family RNA polymerase sigma factor [Kribbella flavida]ADB35381.1 RNA polymerase, sigma-24 subunit, ECF subfamily [Kribbella flavida DSM 17836]